MLKIAVCDDEQEYIETACAMLEQYAAECGLEFTADVFINPSELLDRIESGIHHDIYLLDIYMPGVSGMSVATELRSLNVQSPIVFLTSSADHAVAAFGVDATHYLLKPYTRQNFFAAMDKAVQSVSAYRADSIVLKADTGHCNVTVSNILYCRAEDKYQRIFMAEGEELLVRITASELYTMLEAFGGFYRCGRGHIVNLDRISKITSKSVMLKNGAELPLPRGVASGLCDAFFSHFK